MSRAAPFLALALLVAGCSVARRSGEFTCETQADCSNGRTCSDGLCIAGFGGGPDDAPSAQCPASCTGCDPGTKRCVISCASNPELCARPITCPDGWSCEIDCSQVGSCRAGIDCAGAASCEIACSGVDSCRDITCGVGRCEIACSATGSCAQVECADTCACSVRCGGTGSCAAISCPDGCGGQGGGCNTRRDGCDTCL